jgi:Uma2 family endonuclease
MQIELNFKNDLAMSAEEFFIFCQQNPDLKLEREADGTILLGMPTGTKTGRINAKLIAKLYTWAETTQSGEVFDSSTGFTLPDQSIRSPDVAWVAKTRWESLTEAQKDKFAPICPDFVIELMSETDGLKELKKKMSSYIENGCQLAWLICPSIGEAYIYRNNGEVIMINDFENKKLSGEQVLVGFELDLSLLK